MLTEVYKQNIFNSPKDYYLVCPVNTVGVMGKGLALTFRQKIPHLFEVYAELCRDQDLTPGMVWPFDSDDFNRRVILFATKEHWLNPSKLEWIEQGLEQLSWHLDFPENDITKIAFPLLGCGCGGLKDTQVVPLLRDFCNKYTKYDFILYR